MEIRFCVALLSVSFLAALNAMGESCPQGSSLPIADGIHTLSQEQAAEHILNHPEPKYPGVAKAAHIQGVVLINAVIGTDGTISDLKPVCGEEILMQAALKAVKKWSYRPFEQDGKALQVNTTIRVVFALNAKKVKP